MIIVWLYIIPLLAGLMCLCPLLSPWLGQFQIIISVLLLSVIVYAVQSISSEGPLCALGQGIYVDALSAILLLLIGVVGFLSALYAMGYMPYSDRDAPAIQHPWKIRLYYMSFNLFLLSLIAMVTVNSLGIYWIAIEASTIFSAFLVGYYSKKEPVEAAWKYIILCTVGIAFALIGLILTYYAVTQAQANIRQGLDWTYLRSIAPTLNPNLLKASFMFILIGFGTKAGLAPMHNWLPDAHSEAPTPVSALLSGVLLKCALYGIIRFSLITNIALGQAFTQPFLLFFGLFSLCIAVPFLLLQKNIKRFLAYSSIEHIGIITTGLGFGTPLAVFGAMFHMVNHALAKPVLFFTAGHLSLKFRSKSIAQIQNAIHYMPMTGTLLLLAGLALAGSPPFSVFLSEFYIAWGGILGHYWLQSGLFILLLVIVFGGFAYQLIRMTIGPSPMMLADTHPVPIGELNRSGVLAMLIPTVLLLILTWWMPAGLLSLLRQAVTIITGGSLP